VCVRCVGCIRCAVLLSVIVDGFSGEQPPAHLSLVLHTVGERLAQCLLGVSGYLEVSRYETPGDRGGLELAQG
jgi:hypothetical protein